MKALILSSEPDLTLRDIVGNNDPYSCYLTHMIVRAEQARIQVTELRRRVDQGVGELGYETTGLKEELAEASSMYAVLKKKVEEELVSE